MDESRLFWLTEADFYISECRTRATSLRASEFALRLRRTPVQLARAFHAAVGCSVKEYFNERRIELARELLRSTSRCTSEIAAAAGFGTCRSFYRAFRRCTGMSPTQYRKGMSLAVPPMRP